MPVLKRALTLMVIAVVGWGIFSVPVVGKSDSPSLPAAPDLVQQVVQSFDALTDYRCQMYSSRLRKDGTMAVDTNNYFFKKPKLIRLEVTSGGDKGSKVVLNKKGKVRAKAGGVLGVFTITMEPTDKRLQDGDSSFVTTDLGSTLKDLQLTMTGAKATVTLIEGPRRAGGFQQRIAQHRQGRVHLAPLALFCQGLEDLPDILGRAEEVAPVTGPVLHAHQPPGL